MKRSFGLLALLVLAGCGEDPVAPPRPVACYDLLENGYTELAADTVDTASGLRYIEIETGTGAEASVSSMVDVNYAGYLTNGGRFDTSCPANRTVMRFTLGRREMIPGFELGVLGMRPGGVRRLIIPAELGYRDVPTGPIPPNSTLIFDVQLVDIY